MVGEKVEGLKTTVQKVVLGGDLPMCVHCDMRLAFSNICSAKCLVAPDGDCKARVSLAEEQKTRVSKVALDWMVFLHHFKETQL
jgi:hypothetical protein